MWKVGRRRAWKLIGKESGVQSEVDTGVDLVRFWEGFSKPLNEMHVFCCMYLPSFPFTLVQC